MNLIQSLSCILPFLGTCSIGHSILLNLCWLLWVLVNMHQSFPVWQWGILLLVKGLCSYWDNSLIVGSGIVCFFLGFLVIGEDIMAFCW